MSIIFDKQAGHFVEHARAPVHYAPAQPIDMHVATKTGNMPNASKVDARDINKAMLEVSSWLPYAAEAYNTSPRLSDYVITPVTIFYSDIPNANLAAFPFPELTAWNTNAGRVAYKTWRGKPTHLEHANDDPSKARGVIFDAAMRPVTNVAGDVYRVVLLAGWDRNRDPELAAKIGAGPYGFSMGSWVSDYTCSACSASLRKGGCSHISPRNGVLQSHAGDRLVYRQAHGITGFELSAVATPAFRAAVGRPIG